MSIEPLNERALSIFQKIVETYLSSGEASGSRNLSKALDLGISPASIRNVMSDLEELGLIFAPHISAGRMPTQTGLRYFVDSLVESQKPSQADRAFLEKEINKGEAQTSIDTILNKASGVLSGVSKGAGLVFASKSEAPLRQLEFLKLDNGKTLAILVFYDGRIENRLVNIEADLPPFILQQASNYINAKLAGKSLQEAKKQMAHDVKSLENEVDHLSSKLIKAGLATWAGDGEKSRHNLIIKGQANLLGDIKASEDLERLQLLFQDLEAQNDIIDLLNNTESGEGVKIFIGSENRLFSLSGSSMIVAPYKDRDNFVVGAIGVVGPTRLNYQRIIPVVDYTAHLLSDILGNPDKEF